MDIVVRDLGVSHKGALLLGLSIIVYNYSGWDNVSRTQPKWTNRSATIRVRSQWPWSLRY